MNYFQAYLPSLDEPIIAAWESQIAEAENAPWLAQALATKSAEIFPRFAGAYAQLRRLPRGARRALQRHLARSVELAEIFPGALQQKLARSLAGAALLLALGQGTARAATIIVDTTNPAINTGDTKCSLIEAIINANNDNQSGSNQCTAGSGADIIQLPANKTHTLTSRFANYNLTYTGLPLIAGTITIEGNGGKIARKRTALTFRLLDVGVAGNLTLRNLTLSGGRADDDGGGVFNAGTLTIEDSTVSGNSSADEGGGLFNADSATMTVRRSKILRNKSSEDGAGVNNEENSTLIIEDSTISGNSSGADGGGIGSEYYGTFTITNSTISNNKAAEDGGGFDIAQFSTVTITNSTISGNRAGDEGGGVHVEPYAVVVINDSTISGNKAADDGGGVQNEESGTVTINNSTLSGNSAAGRGGGIFNNYDYYNFTTYIGTVVLNNSTIASNKSAIGGGGVFNEGSFDLNRSLISGNKAPTGRELYNESTGTVTASNYNIFEVSNNAGTFGFTPAAPDVVPTVTLGKIIGPLKLNAPGTTKTRALPTNSPAIDIIPSGDPGCTGTPTDQRGVTRPQGTGCDVGAFEKQ